MKRTLAHALSAVVLMATAAPLSQAGDYTCTNSAGCVARKAQNGKLVATNFRKGDLISTKDGWIVDPDDGWNKVKPKNTSRGT